MDNIGEIYLIRNKQNGKCYVGQARKEVGKVKLKWGTNGRWKSHLREAKNTIEKGQKDHCVLLNNAIRKYDEDSFEVIMLCECKTVEEMDEREAHFIRIHNSMVPNGYNLNKGGAKGQDSEETREKKRQMRLGQAHTEETKTNISKGQLGNRRTVKERAYPEDVHLPKYIVAKRQNGEIVGYAIHSFPVGIEEKKYITKGFNNKKNPEEALKNALEYLQDLQNTYQTEKPQIEKKETNNPTVERTKKNDKQGADKYDMPKYIILKVKDNAETGFAVDGLRIINDDGSITRYSKSFTNSSQTMSEKLEAAKDDLEKIKLTTKCLIDEHILPKNTNEPL